MENKTIKLNMNESNTKFVSFDVSKNKYKVYGVVERRVIHIAYLDTFKEARMLAGLVSMAVQYHDLTNVTCLKTYILRKYNNILSIQEEAMEEQDKKRYKKTRKFYSVSDIYGSNLDPSSREDFGYSEKFKEGLD